MAPSSSRRDELALDDQPLAVFRSVDGRHLIVTLPYEVWVLDSKSLATQRVIPLTMARPSVAEGWEGTLWIAGQHLYRGSVQSTSATKIGTKLGGYVEHLCLVRDDLLCGVGSAGELLWDIDREAPVQIINLRMVIVGLSPKPRIPATEPVDAQAEPERSIEVFVDGTPTLFVNGKRAANPSDFDAVKEMIESELSGGTPG